MKPIKLTIEGLNSFVAKQELDFSKLGDSAIFGIFGQTGSGKSTVLDAICLALFGNVERSKSNVDFINLKTKFTRVEFYFEYTEKNKTKLIKVLREYRLSRSSDVTQKAQVFEVEKSGEKMLMEGPTKVDAYLKELIGLTQNEFSKCVALPQGEFAGFLKAKPNERINIIGGIFDLNKYGEPLWEKARARATKTQAELANIKTKIEILGDINDALMDKKVAEFKQLEKNIAENKEMIEKSTETLGKERDLAKASKELEEVESMLKNLATSGADISDKKQKIAKARAIQDNSVLIDTVNTLNKTINEEESNIDKLNAELDSKSESSKKEIAQNEINIENLRNESNNLSEKRNAWSVANSICTELKSLHEQESILISKLSELDIAKTDAVQEKEENEKRLEILKSDYDKEKKRIQDLEERLVGYYDVSSYTFYVKERAAVDSYIKYIDLLVKGAINLKANSNSKVNDCTKEINKAVAELKKLRKEALGGNTKLDINSKTPILVDAINNLVILLSKLNITEEYIKNLVDREDEYNRENLIRNKKVQLAVTALNKEKITKSDALQKIESLQRDIENLEKQRVDAICNNSVAEFSEKYKIGDTCPICNNEILTKNVLAKLDVIVIEKEIEKQKKELAKQNKQAELSTEIIAQLSKEIEDQNEEMSYNNDSITAIELEITSKCSKLLNKKNARPADISIVQLQLKEDIVKLEEQRKLENEKLERIAELESEKNKYNSIFIASSDKLDDYNELSKSINDFKSKIDAEISFVTQGTDIEVRIEELNKLQKQKKDSEISANQLHNSIVEVNEIIKKLAETYSAVTAEADLKQEALKKLNKDIKFKSSQVEQFSDIKSFDKEINKAEIRMAVIEKEINLNTINIDKLRQINAEITSKIANANMLLSEHKSLRNGTLDSLMTSLNAVGIENFDDIPSNKLAGEDIKTLENFTNNYDGNVAVLLKRKEDLEKILGGKVVDPILIANIETTLENTTTVMNQRIAESGKLKSEIEVLNEQLKQLKELKDIENTLTANYNIQSELCDSLRGKALVEFVAEEFMDDITYMASEKLVDLMDGRYILKYENKDFIVVDNFNNGEERSARTLSGGELFVVSLALALSISDALLSKSDKRLDFFFLDEGFGTLDKDYCEYIISALNKLANKNMTIGLISHIPELQERIQKKFIITKATNESGSIVKLVREV